MLFDPFFHRNFGIYQFVPDELRRAIFAGHSPYDNIDLIFISHAHDDHFNAADTIHYLTSHTSTELIAPQQAVEALAKLTGFENISARVHSVNLELGDTPWNKNLKGIAIDGVRIPHAGWPGRANIQNILFRVSINKATTIMHLGDADPKVEHYLPYRNHWQKIKTDMAFPPYWFFHSAEGRDILDTYLHTEQQIGVHVPVKVPKLLINIGREYFAKPGETRQF